MRSHQRGTTTVEFAICGAVLLMGLIGCLEIARAFFVWNTVTEATRRGARVAAVCPINDGNVLEAAIFAPGGGDNPILADMTTGNVEVTYMTSTGATTTSYDNARYVTVSVSDFNFEFVTPFIGGTIAVPPFSTTVPVESLGLIPPADRQCPGA